MNNRGKGLVRAGNRKGTASKKVKPAERRAGRPSEPAACRRCGAIFSRRVWRRERKVTGALLERVRWTECPACKQASNEEYQGRVVVRGAYASAHEEEIRRRIANVEAQARFKQPQRRVVSAERDGAVFEVLTTSQKLAHRIAHELKKAFRGRTSYKWSDDGSLFAVWERNA
jgi:NMD protein affecting ribosome stability and mRNA decay